MSSAYTRLQIVQFAVSQVGRGPELYSHARRGLNLLLRALALRNKYPILRKIGAEATLLAGSTTVSLPSTFGAGSDSLLFGTERIPLQELSADEFVDRGGFPASGAGTGRPTFYMVDKNASVFRFNRVADVNYGFIPIYFEAPAKYDDNPAGGSEVSTADNQPIWYENDHTIIQYLIQLLMQWKEDGREMPQADVIEKIIAQDLRGLTPNGGGPVKLRLSPTVFK